MASTSTSNANLIQFPRLPSVAPIWDSTGDKVSPGYPLPPRAGRSLKQSRSTESLTQRKDRVEFLRRREWTRRIAASGDQPIVPTVSSPFLLLSPPCLRGLLPCPHTSLPAKCSHHVDVDANADAPYSSAPPPPQRRERTYSWEDIVAAADAAASTYDYNSSGYAGRPDTIDETDEDEPYVIYTATPRASAFAPTSSLSFSPSTSFSLASPSAYTYTPNTPVANVIYSTSASQSPSTSPTLSPLSSSAPMPSIGNGGPQHGRRASWRGPHSRHSSLSSISEEDEGLARF
uniref:Hsp70 n=1 Tax=Ganoderma boninense TaxID=34458 RepID=A0A5K1K6P6_9APHY|nr:Hsp70 [Ganoderma boninense]